MPGMPRAKLCRALLDCMHREGCAVGGVTTDCFCGKDVDPDECFDSRTYDQANGPCKELAAAAGGTHDPTKLKDNCFDPRLAAGAAVAVVEMCDQYFCEFECLAR